MDLGFDFLVLIMVRLFNFSPEDIGNYFRKKTTSLANELKGNQQNASATIALDPEEETPVVIDTYTHKEDIPPLKKEPVEKKEEKLEITTSKEEPIEELAMEVEKVTNTVLQVELPLIKRS